MIIFFNIKKLLERFIEIIVCVLIFLIERSLNISMCKRKKVRKPKHRYKPYIDSKINYSYIPVINFCKMPYSASRC